MTFVRAQPFGGTQSTNIWWKPASKVSRAVPCVYTYSEGSDIIIMTLYVDDVVLLEKTSTDSIESNKS